GRKVLSRVSPAHAKALSRPHSRPRGTDALGIQGRSGNEIPAVAPNHDGSASAVGHDGGIRLVTCGVADRLATNPPKHVSVGIDTLDVDIVLRSRAQLSPGEERATRTIGSYGQR